MGGRRFWAVNGALLAAVAAVAYFGLTSLFHTASARTAPRTVTAAIGTVTQTVTASGNVSPAQSENVNFATSGTVLSVDVSVGQQVSAGQTLATLDPAPAQAALTAAQDQLAAAEDNLSLAEHGNETPPQIQQDDATLAADQAAVNTAQSNLTTDQTNYSNDETACLANPKSTSCSLEAAALQAVNQDQAQLTQAQNQLEQENLSIAAKRYANPATIMQDQAQVTQAQETVTEDEKTLAETTLTAPFAGTVIALNGAVGQTVNGSGSTATASTGSSGTSGSTAGGGGSGASAAGASGAGSTSSSSSGAFLTLANLSDMQVVADFPEASAVKVAVGQPATVTLSATGATLTGSVTALSPVPTVVSNVVEYADTITLDNPSPSVHNGMSVTVSVTVASKSGVVEVPTAAVTTLGRVSTVVVLDNGKQTRRTVTTGLVGDTTTQIVSGLSAGDVVVEPSLALSAGTGTGTGIGIGTGAGAGGRAGGIFGGGGFAAGAGG